MIQAKNHEEKSSEAYALYPFDKTKIQMKWCFPWKEA
jgi:hypothetical protein